MIEEKKLHLLIVEDNPDTQTLLRYMLQVRFDLSFSFTVEGALDMAEAHDFDFFLLDINLGEQRTGLDLLKLLRAKDGYDATPALALTAYAMPGDRERFLGAGFNSYISKPFTRAELMETIDQLLVNSTGQA